MVASIADKLTTMKRERDAVNNGTGRDLPEGIGCGCGTREARFEAADSAPRNANGVSTAYEAGETAGASLPTIPEFGRLELHQMIENPHNSHRKRQ
jgi:hypothetical protein